MRMDAVCSLLLACSTFSLASNLFPMTFEFLLKVLLFIRRVLDFVFIIARRNSISDIVSLRIAEIIGFAKNGASNSVLLEEIRGRASF